MKKILSIIIVVIIFWGCEESENLNEENVPSQEVVDHDQIIENELIGSAMPTELISIPLDGNEGEITGTVWSVEMGDYAHISIKDSLDRVATFYVGDTPSLTAEQWEDLLDEKYDGAAIYIKWAKVNKFIEQIDGYEEVNEAQLIKILSEMPEINN